MGPARIYPWRKMLRSRAPSIAPGTFFVAQSWADCITNMAGFNLRQAQALHFGFRPPEGPSRWPLSGFVRMFRARSTPHCAGRVQQITAQSQRLFSESVADTGDLGHRMLSVDSSLAGVDVGPSASGDALRLLLRCVAGSTDPRARV